MKSHEATRKMYNLGHLTNIPLLMRFLTKQELEQISSETLTAIPKQYKIRQFHFFENNKSAKARKMKLDLDKAI